MKVLVSQPPSHTSGVGSRWPFKIEAPTAYLPYPFRLGYTVSLLKRDTTAEVVGFDPVAQWMSEPDFLNFLSAKKPDLIILDVPTIVFDQSIVLAKEIKEQTGALITFAGPHVTAFSVETLQKAPWVSFCLIGEYEETAKELVQSLLTSRDIFDEIKRISGLAWQHEGKIQVNPRRPLIKNLDYLPWPDRVDFPAEIYTDFVMAGLPCIQMITSRGCPSGCVFCVERWVLYNSSTVRCRGPADVVNEMEYLKHHFKAKQVYIDDMSFTIKKQHVLEICNEILRRKLELPWTAMADTMFITYEMLEKMKEAGCLGIKFGVESGDPEILKSIGKPLNLGRVREVIKWCHKLGVWIHATYCLGLPGETKDTIARTLEYAVELDSDSAQVSLATPYPGTPFFDWAEKNGYLTTRDWRLYDGSCNAIVSTLALTKDELREAYEWFCETYRQRAARRKLRRMLTDFGYAYRSFQSSYRRGGASRVFKSAKRIFSRALGE